MNTIVAAELASAARALGFDSDDTFGALLTAADSPYRAFRWSVGKDRDGGPVIHALPPEEEVGWTPWERWCGGDDGPRHESWVKGGSLSAYRWHRLEENASDLQPRLTRPGRDLSARLGLARVDAGFAAIGVDVQTEVIGTIGVAEARYLQYRWAVIPHWIADDGPVVYAIPPLDRAADWPWESWYRELADDVIHHVHYTAPREGCPNQWREEIGAPQRPPEILGLDWWWGAAADATPAMASPGAAGWEPRQLR